MEELQPQSPEIITPEPVPKKIGRPSDYTQELADKICAQLTKGDSLRTVCKADDMPSTVTIFSWFRKYPEFLSQYARAKEESADALAEEIMDIADDSLHSIVGGKDSGDNARIQSYRLKVDTRKWIMSKMKPKKYGDKMDHTTNGKDLPVINLSSAIAEKYDTDASTGTNSEGHA